MSSLIGKTTGFAGVSVNRQWTGDGSFDAGTREEFSSEQHGKLHVYRSEKGTITQYQLDNGEVVTQAWKKNADGSATQIISADEGAATDFLSENELKSFSFEDYRYLPDEENESVSLPKVSETKQSESVSDTDESSASDTSPQNIENTMSAAPKTQKTGPAFPEGIKTQGKYQGVQQHTSQSPEGKSITHYQYAEANSADLVSLPEIWTLLEQDKELVEAGTLPELPEYLIHKDALEPTIALLEAAKKSGHKLVLVPPLRTIDEQEYLFNEVNRQNTYQSAPPGYSEHHTGFAIDFADPEKGKLIKADTHPEAIAWLKENAGHYGFELSFPEGNEQGISYEPWHYRYVGSESARTALHRELIEETTAS